MRIACIAIVMILTSVVARAEPDAARKRRQALEHTQRGVAFYRLEKYADAIEEFEQAYLLHSSAQLLYNLGQAHRKAGNCQQALRFYKQYLAVEPAPPRAADVRKLLPSVQQACAVKDGAPVDVDTGAPRADGPAWPGRSKPPAADRAAAPIPAEEPAVAAAVETGAVPSGDAGPSSVARRRGRHRRRRPPHRPWPRALARPSR